MVAVAIERDPSRWKLGFDLDLDLSLLAVAYSVRVLLLFLCMVMTDDACRALWGRAPLKKLSRRAGSRDQGDADAAISCTSTV